MPLVCRVGEHRLFFYANEGNPLEPVHVHVESGTRKAKFWLRPEVELAFSRGYTPHELRRLVEIVRDRRAEIEEKWHDFFD